MWPYLTKQCVPRGGARQSLFPAPVYAPSGNNARRQPSRGSGRDPSRGNCRPGGSCRRRAGRRSVQALSLEGVSQMDSILPERLLALVRPAFDLVLRRIRSLKRCVQAYGCKIVTPRYACNLAPGCISSEPTFAGLRKNKKKRNQGVPKKRGPRKKGKRGFLWQSLTSLEMQPGAKFRHISRGHYCSHTPARSVLNFESFAGRGQMLDGRVLGASQVE